MATSKTNTNLLLLFCLTFLLTSCSTPLKKRKILIIGDSNAAAERGWVFQFQQLRQGGPLVNTAISGNTVGFDDGQNIQLNTLNQLVLYLRRGYAEMAAIDDIVIALGTNDCKAVYRNAGPQRHVNYRTLLEQTKAFFTERGQQLPRIVLVAPPPMAADAVLHEEFQGGAACVQELATFIEGIATTEGYCFSNLIAQPGARLLEYSEDGVHFNATGYELIARQLIEDCF